MVFPKIDKSISEIRWSCLYSAPFRIAEHITAMEGRSTLWGMRWTCKHARYHGQRHLRLVDNFGLSLLLEKGRGHVADFSSCRRLGSSLRLPFSVALAAVGVERGGPLLHHKHKRRNMVHITFWTISRDLWFVSLILQLLGHHFS